MPSEVIVLKTDRANAGYFNEIRKNFERRNHKFFNLTASTHEFKMHRFK